MKKIKNKLINGLLDTLAFLDTNVGFWIAVLLMFVIILGLALSN